MIRSLGIKVKGVFVIDAEKIVIGICLNDGTAVERAKKLGLTTHHFQEPLHQKLWADLGDGRIENPEAPYLLACRKTAPLTQNVEFYAAPLIWRDFRLEFLADVEGLLKSIPTTAHVEVLMTKLLNKSVALRCWEGSRG